MKTFQRTLLAVSLLATGCFTSILLGAEPEPGFNSLFNGKDLTGWEGRPEHWSVEDGAITGRTTKEHPAKGNNFLFWRPNGANGVVDDFELRLSYRIVANNDKGFANSGIQYRSKDLGNFVAGGYQADFENGKTFSGILYDEAGGAGRRNIMAQRGEKVVWTEDCKKEVTGSLGKSEEIQAKIKNADWNDYVVIAHGNHLQHFINGVPTVDVTDNCESKRLTSGILALQLHAGEPMTVQFKNIRIKKLSAKASARSDFDRVQGDWQPVEIVSNGKPSSADTLAATKVKMKGNEYFLDRPNRQDQGTFKLNETTTPRSMDLTTQSGTAVPGIYEVSDDTFKACYALNGASRPTKFESPEGSDQVLIVYKRKTE